jgi:cysteinyl-tRNA synthetase
LIMNITNIDDKIILRSAQKGIDHIELSQKYERDYYHDMNCLHVQPPTIITRVTEYMDEVVCYIQNIINNGFAYESNGSVYFDCQAFDATPGCYTCKLMPEQKYNATLLAEGEGACTTNRQEYHTEKRHARDFALWKAAKDGEPVWDSPWGCGRPGWHIECSCMASDVVAKITGHKNMDLHSGGVDLKFPHHDNEMSQAEAEDYDHTTTSTPPPPQQWVNYFLHSGHLDIDGSKMSKSLKNFITIQQALKINTSRQIRLLFLLHKYNAPMDYDKNTMHHAVTIEKMFGEFFHNVKAVMRQYDFIKTEYSQKLTPEAVRLQQKLTTTQTAVDVSLRDDFDTPKAMSQLMELIKATNVYLNTTNSTDKPVLSVIIESVALYITRMLRVFGVIFNDGIGFTMADNPPMNITSPSSPSNNNSNNNISTISNPALNDCYGMNDDHQSSSREIIVTPILDALMEFRAKVRDAARTGDQSTVLKLCDLFRDEMLPPLGVRLEDKKDGSIWK